MKQHTFMFPINLGETLAKLYVLAVMKEFKIDLPVSVKIIMPDKNYEMRIE